jgi:hypothetical protein
MNRNLVGSIYMYERFCIKFPQSRMKGEPLVWWKPCILFVYICIVVVVGDLIIKRDSINWFNPRHIFVPVSSKNLDFHWQMSWSISVFNDWFEVRGGGSFCWYCCNCWPSLFKLSFHNETLLWYIDSTLLKIRTHSLSFLSPCGPMEKSLKSAKEPGMEMQCIWSESALWCEDSILCLMNDSRSIGF